MEHRPEHARADDRVELGPAYEAAWRDWVLGEDQAFWDATTGDGLLS